MHLLKKGNMIIAVINEANKDNIIMAPFKLSQLVEHLNALNSYFMLELITFPLRGMDMA
jgi:hypothetical protein